MADILRATRSIPHFHSQLHLHMIDINAALVPKQKAALEQHQDSLASLQWHESLHNVPTDIPAFFIGNEFFDALPIQQFEYQDNHWHERLIGYDSQTDKLHFTLSPPVPLHSILGHDITNEQKEALEKVK